MHDRPRGPLARWLLEKAGLAGPYEFRKPTKELSEGGFADVDEFLLHAAACARDLKPVRNARRLRRNDIVLISCVRNESARLPGFLSHYRRLGVDRFLFLDHNSSDGSLELLLAEPDADVWRARGHFGRSTLWLTAMAQAFARGRWAVFADADELLVYDGMERHDLHDLAAWLERQGAQRMRGFMIDLYGKGPIRTTPQPAGDEPLKAEWWFDGEGYSRAGDDELRGGPRSRSLSRPGAPFDNALQKIPFARFDAASAWVNIHYPYPFHLNRGAHYAAVLHLKFTSDFPASVDRAVAEGEHWRNAYEYEIYQRALRENPDLSFFGPVSRRYEGARSLIDAGLLAPIDWNAAMARPAADPYGRAHRRHAAARAILGPHFLRLRWSR